jgi:hypothetical protein
MTSALSTFLKPGGSLIVIDLLEKMHPVGDAKSLQERLPGVNTGDIISRSHFVKEDVEKIFTDAGLAMEIFEETFGFEMFENVAKMFIASGVKNA